MTYMLNGQQYIVVAISGPGYPGELIAYRLPAELSSTDFSLWVAQASQPVKRGSASDESSKINRNPQAVSLCSIP